MRYLPVQRQLPVVGQPHRWALDLAVGGALLPFVTLLLPALLTFSIGPPVGAVLLPLALATGLLGGVLGLCTPLVLGKLRRNVPLGLLALLASTSTTTAMMAAAWLVAAPSQVALLWVILGAGLGTFLWLPYLVMTALGKPTWPVITLGLAGSSAVTVVFLSLL